MFIVEVRLDTDVTVAKLLTLLLTLAMVSYVFAALVVVKYPGMVDDPFTIKFPVMVIPLLLTLAVLVPWQLKLI